MMRVPPATRVLNRGTRKRRLIAVIVGRSSKRPSAAYSSRIRVGVSTWKRALPSRTTALRAALAAVGVGDRDRREEGGASSGTGSSDLPQPKGRLSGFCHGHAAVNPGLSSI